MRRTARYGLAIFVGVFWWAGQGGGSSPIVTQAVFAQRTSALTRYEEDANEEEQPRLLKREGTQLINVVGRFQNEGDSAVFISKDGMSFGGLPNLSLERVIATLKSVEDPTNVWWSINGVVTEFSGKNYVLISRAVFKAASPPPPPQPISEPEQR